MIDSGIYCITCIKTNKSYIGQSKNVINRINSHKSTLKRNKSSSILLQRAYNKYGKNSFRYSILGYYKEDHLDEAEVFFIKMFNSIENGFNIESGGNKNKTLSLESRKKMSEAKLGKPGANKGTKASLETRIKLSLSHMGKPNPRKGIKTNKKPWNYGKFGVQESTRKIPIEVIDTVDNIKIGIFESKTHFRESVNYKSKNIRFISEKESRLGRYLLIKI